MNKDWIIGFTEGDGCFYIQRRTQLPMFSITQKETEILEKIKDFFGFGKVYVRYKRNTPRFWAKSQEIAEKLHRTANSIMARNGYKWHIKFVHHNRYPENFQYANIKEALE